MDGSGVSATPLRILLFGDGAWATGSLQRLSQTSHQLLGLVIRRQPTDPELVTLARELGLPLFQPQQVNAPEFLAQVTALEPDLNLSISYNQILRRPILDIPGWGFINFHAGKLPYYRGRNVINWALINGETELGVTAHFVDEGIDTGDIILQRTLPISWADTYGDLLDRVVAAFPDFVLEAVELIASGQAQRQPQAHLPGTYFSGRGEGDEWLDWSDTSRNLHNKVRAITRPGPGARSVRNNEVVIIWRAFYDPSWPDYIATPGQVVGRTQAGVLVKTGDSTLLLQEIEGGNGEPQIPTWSIGIRLGLNLMSYLRSLESRLQAVEKDR